MFNNASLLAWVFLLGAALLSCLPFFINRLALVKPIEAKKALHWALLESLALFAVWLSLFMLYENYIGKTQNQSWQFYAIAACLWAVLIFPAFAWTRLRK